MAWGTPTLVGSEYTAKSSDDVAYPATSVTVDAETLLFVVGVCDNTGTSTPTVSFDKPGGESRSWRIVYHNSASSGSGAGTRGWIAYIRTSVAWSAHSLTGTYSAAVTAKHAACYSVTGGLTGDNVATWNAGTSTAAGSGINCGNAGYALGSLQVGVASQETTAGPGVDLNGQAVNNLMFANTSGQSAATNIGIGSAYIIQNGGSTNGNLTVTGSASVDGGGVTIVLPDAAAAPALTGQKAGPVPIF